MKYSKYFFIIILMLFILFLILTTKLHWRVESPPTRWSPMGADCTYYGLWNPILHLKIENSKMCGL